MNKDLKHRYFITGIGTDVGKTIISAILTEKLNANYWKPIQAGDLDNSDSIKVKKMVRNTKTIFFPEQFKLSQPMSPHAAAQHDKRSIELNDFVLPDISNNLIIEGAGGILVPINLKGETIADLIEHLQLEIILVIQNYLGSINHSLLSISELQKRKIPIKGIIFNGDSNIESEKIIQQISGIKILGKIPKLNTLDPFEISNAGNLIQFS